MQHSQNPKVLLKLIGPVLYIVAIGCIVDFPAVFTLLAQIRFAPLSLSALLFPLLTAIFTLRWWIIARQLGMHSSFGSLSAIYYVSWFLGVLPFGGVSGIAKVVYLKNTGEKASTAATSIAFDKLIDVIGLLIFGLIGILYIPTGLMDTRILWLAWGIAAVVIFMAILQGPRLISVMNRVTTRYRRQRLARLLHKLELLMTQLWEEFTYTTALAHTFLTSMINVLRALVLFLLAVSLGIEIGFMPILACRALVGLINIIPVTINGLGTRDAILVLLLPIWGVSQESAIALGMTAFLWNLFSQLASSVFWVKLPLPIRSLRDMKKNIFNSNEGNNHTDHANGSP